MYKSSWLGAAVLGIVAAFCPGMRAGVAHAQVVEWARRPEIPLDVAASIGGIPTLDKQALAIAPDGSIYGTGSIANPDRDILLLKSDANGNRVWQRAFNADGLTAYGVGIAADSSSAAIVAATTFDPDGAQAIVVAKHHASGALAWQRVVQPVAGQNAHATAVRVDAADNIIVAGYGMGASGTSDFVLLKYDAAGTLLWQRQANTAGDGAETAVDMEIDATGNIVVAGYTQIGGAVNAVTVKYDASGSQLWLRELDGGALGRDEGRAVVVDAEGNVFVAGIARMLAAGTDAILLAKYDGGGTLQWMAQADDPAANDMGFDVALGPAGSLIVVGTSASRFMLARYEADGAQSWVRTTPGYMNALASAVAVDAAGTINATGRGSAGPNVGMILVRYSAAGALLWARDHDAGYDANGGSLAIAANGVLVVGGSETEQGQTQDAMFRRYDASGNVLSTTTEDVGIATITRLCDYCRTSAVRAGGGLVMVATGRGASGMDEVFVIALQPDGSLAWHHEFGAGLIENVATGVAVDPAGNVLVSAYARTQAGRPVGLVAKLSTSGQPLWQRTLDDPDGTYQIEGIGTDVQGNALLVGTRVGANPPLGPQMTAVKYDPNGTRLWVREVTFPDDNEEGRVLAVHSSGDVVIAGSSPVNVVVARITAAGSIAWQGTTPATFDFGVNSIVLDNGANAYIAGGHRWSGPGPLLRVIKFAADGQFQWSREVAGLGGSARGVAVDSAGKVIAVGSIDYPDARAKLATVKYDAAGELQWLREIDTWGTPTGVGPGYALAVLEADDVVVAGYSESDPSLGSEFRVARYDSQGALRWDLTYPVAGRYACAYEMAAMPSRDLYVSGMGSGCVFGTELLALRIRGDTLLINGFEN